MTSKDFKSLSFRYLTRVLDKRPMKRLRFWMVFVLKLTKMTSETPSSRQFWRKNRRKMGRFIDALIQNSRYLGYVIENLRVTR